jgi:hypothetical protein
VKEGAANSRTMQAGKVVVSDGTAASWDALPRDSGSIRPVSAQFVAQQQQRDYANAVMFAQEPTADDHKKFLQFSDGSFRLVRAGTMVAMSAGTDTVGATGAAGVPIQGAMGATGATGVNGSAGATGANGTMGAVGATGATSATGAQGATGAVVGGGQGVRGVTGPARAALKTAVGAAGAAPLTVRRASLVVVPGAPATSASAYALPASSAVSPTAAFEAVYTDGELVPSSGGWTTSSAATMTLDLGSASAYAVWSFGVSATSSVTCTLRAETSVGTLVLHTVTNEPVPSTAYREYVMDDCAWPATKIMLDVTACTNLRVYFRLLSVA